MNAPPTELVVGFSEKVNVQKLFFNAYEQTSQETVSAVYVQGADGAKYFPRLESYDTATNQAHFLMLDGLPNGTYQLHLSGAQGLTDLAGNALVANDPSGDYVVSFTVAGPARGVSGSPLQWATQAANDAPAAAQDLGVLFPHELVSGVTITRDFTNTPGGVTDTADYYQIQLLQNQSYAVNLSGTSGVQVTVTDLAGNPVNYTTSDGRALQITLLAPGTYLVRVDGWQANQATQVVYQLQLNLAGAPDNAPALTTGPAPALQLRLANDNPTPPAQIVSPPSTGNGNIVLVSAQTNGVTFPTLSLLQLASGPLGGVTDSSGSSTLASGERVAFHLPEAPAPANLFFVLTANLTFGSAEDSTLPPALESRNTIPAIESRNTTPAPEALPDNQLSRLLDRAVPVPDGVVIPTPLLTIEQEFGPGNGSQPEGPSTAETDAEAIGDGVLARLTPWILGPGGIGLVWLAYQTQRAFSPAIPRNGMGSDGATNPQEGAS